MEELTGFAQIVSSPRGPEVFFQEPRALAVIDADHQIVPMEVVIAEVDSAQVEGLPIDEVDFLMVSEENLPEEETVGGGDLDLGSRSLQAGEEVEGSPLLLPQIRAEEVLGRSQEAVVDHVEGKGVDKEASVSGAALHEGFRQREAGAVAFEGEHLAVDALLGLKDLFTEVAPELTGINEKRIGALFHHLRAKQSTTSGLKRQEKYLKISP